MENIPTSGSMSQGGNSKKEFHSKQNMVNILIQIQESYKKANKIAKKSGGYLAEIETYDEGVALFEEITGLLTKKDLKRPQQRKCRWSLRLARWL